MEALIKRFKKLAGDRPLVIVRAMGRRCYEPRRGGCRPFGVAAFLRPRQGVIVLAALLALWRTDQSGHRHLAGIALAITWFKPTLSGPYILPYILEPRWPLREVIVFAGTLALLSIGLWAMIATNPLEVCVTALAGLLFASRESKNSALDPKTSAGRGPRD